MADPADIAGIEIERTLERGLQNQAAKLRDSGITDCVDCGIIIDPRRKEAVPSATRCIDCEEIA